MTTVTLWLLISIGGARTQPLLIERFNSAQDCEAVRAQLPLPAGLYVDAKDQSKCVLARVAR